MSAEAQIKSFVDRVLRLKEEQDTIGQDIRDIYAEAKSLGFDKTQLGNVVSHVRKVEKKGRDAINEGNAIFDMYLAAYEGTGTPVATRAHTHEAKPEKAGRLNATDIYLAACQEAENYDPETGEILESVQSHEALGPSAPAESASDEMSAGEAAPSGLPTNSEPDQTSKSTAARNGARKTGVTAGETATNSQAKASVDNGATGPGIEAPADSVAGDASRPSRGGGTPAFNSNPQASPSRQADKAETAPPVVSAAFNNPKCLNPKTCPNAHSKTACFDCVMEYGKRPPEEQKRLWAEATGGRDAA